MLYGDKSAMCTGIFDSHAHYFDKRFEVETEGADYILQNEVFSSGICGVINVGTNLKTSQLCIDQAMNYGNMYAAVGIHPEDVMGIDDSVDVVLETLERMICDRKAHKIVALGEIGLDYHYDDFDKQLQQVYFEQQIEIALKYDMPVIIHDRDAHADCFETVIKYPGLKGVFHSFSGSTEMARELIKRGWFISFSGVLTFKNARRAVEVAQSIPIDRILIETDAPYLAPHPHRGKINHSGYMYLLAERLADIKGMPVGDVISQTAANTRILFGIE